MQYERSSKSINNGGEYNRVGSEYMKKKQAHFFRTDSEGDQKLVGTLVLEDNQLSSTSLFLQFMLDKGWQDGIKDKEGKTVLLKTPTKFFNALPYHYDGSRLRVAI